jgi:hypothetical protein
MYTIICIILTLIPKWMINVSLSLQVNVIIIWQTVKFMLKLYVIPSIELEYKYIYLRYLRTRVRVYV